MKAIKNKKFIYLIISVAVVAIAVLGLVNNKKPHADSKSGKTVSVSVETQKIVPETIEQYVSVASKVTANNEISVMPKVSGTVKKV